MLTILEWSDVWTDVSRRAISDDARDCMTHAWELFTAGKVKTIGQALRTAKFRVKSNRQFGHKSKTANRLESCPLDERMPVAMRQDDTVLLMREALQSHRDGALALAYADGYSMTQLAELHGVSVARISQRMAVIVEDVRAELS